MGGVRPMQPVAGDLPAGPEWTFEVDWAGVRLLADVDEGELTLSTADGDDVTARFPEFSGLPEAIADGLLDGEAVMLDGGSPSSAALDERLRVADPRRARSLARQRPAVFMVYDVLRLYGVPLGRRPLDERRAVLRRLDLSRTTRIQISPTYSDGDALLAGVVEQGLAGVVAKRRAGAYGTDDWIRVVPAPRPRHGRRDRSTATPLDLDALSPRPAPPTGRDEPRAPETAGASGGLDGTDAAPAQQALLDGPPTEEAPRVEPPRPSGRHGRRHRDAPDPSPGLW